MKKKPDGRRCANCATINCNCVTLCIKSPVLFYRVGVYCYMEKRTNTPEINTIAERIREIRKFRGLKQSAVAGEMKITQQAYSHIETKSGNTKVGTLQKVCQVLGVELPFLMGDRIPVTTENMEIFDKLNYAAVYADYKRLETKLSLIEELVFNFRSATLRRL